jgi:hypothetical protein
MDGGITYLDTNVDAETEKNVDFACAATARASMVYVIKVNRCNIPCQYPEDQRGAFRALVLVVRKINLVGEKDI